MANTEQESRDLDVIAEALPSARDQQVAKIETDLSSEKDSRKQERFYWALAFAIVMVVFGLDRMQSTTMQVLAGLLVLIFLIGFAAHCGVEKVAVPLQRAYNWLLPPKDGEDEG